MPIKISIKPFKDFYPKFGESNINIKEFKKKKIFVMLIKKLCIMIIQKKKIIL